MIAKKNYKSMHCVASHISSLLKSISCCTLHPIVAWGHRWIYKSQYKHVAVGTYLIFITHIHDHIYNVNQIVATCASICAWGWRDPGKKDVSISYTDNCQVRYHVEDYLHCRCFTLNTFWITWMPTQTCLPVHHVNST